MSEDSLGNINKFPAPDRVRPVLLLLLGGWGVAPDGEANFIRSSKINNWLGLIKEYPVALLSTGEGTLNSRYATLGAGQNIKDENFEPVATLTKIIAASGRKQLKIAETERFASLTYFFNGHAKERASGEEWIIVSSENNKRTVKLSLALKRTVKEIIKALNQEEPYSLIVASIPTVSLEASSGNLAAIKKAVETIDKNLKIIVDEVVDKKGILVITAEAGNAEKMLLPGTDAIDSSMTNNPVPFLAIGGEFKGKTFGLAEPLSTDLSLLEPIGTLADVAPTILDIMKITKPAEMSGRSLLDKN